MQPYDEFLGPNGQPRPHQARLVELVRGHDAAAKDGVRRAIQSRLHEQEVTYNILGTPDGSMRGWELDEIPHIVPHDEFQTLSEGLVDRAELLAACLEDFYGPKRLIKEGVVPAQVLLGNPHFFRALDGITPLGDAHLTMYAADIVKKSDGTYVVHSDRTAAPTGSGYALENRLALGHIFSQTFVDYRIQKVNRFFETMRDTLQGLSPRSAEVPRVVLLTPGVHDESSFEHGYLARYQGFQLVEGRDLTVRGEEVFLKTLGGLKRVDVILRRITDDWCDPLELREDSLLGVAGLVGAVRAGTVAIANPLGSGIMESPAFRAYLPRISDALRGQPLKLPSVSTRHLGDTHQLEEVMDSFDEWLIRPAFDDRHSSAHIVGDLAKEDKEQLRQDIIDAPERFVAELWPVASRVPLGLDLTRQGSLSMRCFACRSGDEFTVMPGGLGRVDDAPDGMFLQGGAEATSKDVWVMGSEGADEPALPRMPQAPVTIQRGGVDIPSRLFDDIFWLGRYTERANHASRIIRTGLEPIQSEGRETPRDVLQGLIRCLIGLQVLPPGAGKDTEPDRAFLAGIFDRSRPNSIFNCMDRVYHLTTATRSRLSTSTWSILRRSHEVLPADPAKKLGADEAVDLLDELLVTLAAFQGITSTTMVRGHAWVFLEMGRRLEQGVFVLTLLEHLFRVGASRKVLETLLSVCDSLLTYRSRYLSNLQETPVVDLLLTDDTNPQSVIYQVRRLLSAVRTLPRAVPFPLSRSEQRLVTLDARLVTADLAKACRGQGEDLRELAEDGVHLLWQVSDDLTQHYFTHATRSRAMAPSHWIDSRLEAGT